ncbi:MAG: hypothetical protein Q8R00_00810 [Candidatus Nanoarchaeia archaeon]|nr:hypothetical protein [Candidatus Nanoarchaeia archaeon]
MSDEDKFYRALKNAGNYYPLYLEFVVKHPVNPGVYGSIDNVGQKGKVIFVFEGKKGGLPEKAIPQLKSRYLILRNPVDKREMIGRGTFNNYTEIRLFYYSLRRGLLIEYTAKGEELNQHRFNPRDINELTAILRNL